MSQAAMALLPQVATLLRLQQFKTACETCRAGSQALPDD